MQLINIRKYQLFLLFCYSITVAQCVGTGGGNTIKPLGIRFTISLQVQIWKVPTTASWSLATLNLKNTLLSETLTPAPVVGSICNE